jgi:hypothetical protein
MSDKKPNTPKTRDDIRKAIFSADASKRQSIKLNFFGTEIELRQASIMEVQAQIERRATSNGTVSIADYLIDYAYVPGTDEKVFESGDKETIAQLPFNKDMTKLTEAITSLTNIDVKAAEKNLPETLSNGA